jgi:cobalt/nickel transport system permease protein
MKLALDQYAHLDSPLHRWHQQLKLIALGGLIFAFAFVETLALLPVMIAITAILFGLSKLPLRFLLSRLQYPGIFIAAVVIVLPLVSGETVLW